MLPFLPIRQPEPARTLDQTIQGLYDVISGPANQARDWAKMRGLFVPGAQMFVAYRDRQGQAAVMSLDVEGYIRESGPILESKGFFEREITRRTEQFGGIAQVFSTYESRFKPKEKPFERGINSIQLVLKGDRWSIASITWQGESKDLPLPARYLAKPDHD